MVAGGSVAAQVVLILAMPFLTRIYEPSAIGILGVFSSIVGILAAISSLSYCYAIVLPKEDIKAVALLSISFRINLATTLICAFSCYFFYDRITNVFNLNGLSMAIWFLPVVVFLLGIRSPVDQWLIRKKRFALIGKISFSQAFFTSFLNIVFGLLWANPINLILSLALSNLFFSGWLFRKINQEITVINEDCFELPSVIVSAAKEYSDFPIFRAPQILLNSFSHSLPVLVFGYLFEPAIAGFYSLGNRVLQLPGNLIASSLGTVLMPELAKTTRANGNLQAQLIKSTILLALFGIIPFGVIFWGGRDLFAFVFGKPWALSGVYSSWLSLQLYCKFINVPAVQALALTNSQPFLLAWEVVTTTGKIVAILVGGIYWRKPEVAVALYSCFGAMAYLLLIFVSISRAGDIKRFRN